MDAIEKTENDLLINYQNDQNDQSNQINNQSLFSNLINPAPFSRQDGNWFTSRIKSKDNPNISTFKIVTRNCCCWLCFGCYDMVDLQDNIQNIQNIQNIKDRPDDIPNVEPESTSCCCWLLGFQQYSTYVINQQTQSIAFSNRFYQFYPCCCFDSQIRNYQTYYQKYYFCCGYFHFNIIDITFWMCWALCATCGCTSGTFR